MSSSTSSSTSSSSTSTLKSFLPSQVPGWLKTGAVVVAAVSILGGLSFGLKYYCNRKGGCSFGGGKPPSGSEIIIPLIDSSRKQTEKQAEKQPEPVVPLPQIYAVGSTLATIVELDSQSVEL